MRNFFLFSSLFAIASGSMAGQGWVKGTVEFARTHDSAYYSSTVWAPPAAWFTLAGITQTGTCPTWNGRTLFVTSDLQEFALVVSALKGGNTLAVYYDDSIVAAPGGHCRAVHITIRAPNAPDIN